MMSLAPNEEESAEPATPIDFSAMDDAEVPSIWAATMGELRRRRVIRSSNNPVAAYAEWLVADRLGLSLATGSTAGYDATARDGTRYQIKARRLLDKRTSRQLSPNRNLDNDPFEFVIVALFDEYFGLTPLWQLPIDLVRDHAAYRTHINAHVLHARGLFLPIHGRFELCRSRRVTP